MTPIFDLVRLTEKMLLDLPMLLRLQLQLQLLLLLRREHSLRVLHLTAVDAAAHVLLLLLHLCTGALLLVHLGSQALGTHTLFVLLHEECLLEAFTLCAELCRLLLVELLEPCMLLLAHLRLIARSYWQLLQGLEAIARDLELILDLANPPPDVFVLLAVCLVRQRALLHLVVVVDDLIDMHQQITTKVLAPVLYLPLS